MAPLFIRTLGVAMQSQTSIRILAAHFRQQGLTLSKAVNPSPPSHSLTGSRTLLTKSAASSAMCYTCLQRIQDSCAGIGSWRSRTTLDRGTSHLGSQQRRLKSKNKKQSDSDAESDSDVDDELDDDDFDAPTNFKVVKITCHSTRADAVVSHGLDIGRSQLEEIFLGSKMFINGQKLLKKATTLEEKDYVDVIMDRSNEQMKVKRVKVLKIYKARTSTDKMILKLRVWKTPFDLAPKES